MNLSARHARGPKEDFPEFAVEELQRCIGIGVVNRTFNKINE